MIIKLATLTRSNRKADKSISISFTTTTEQTVSELSELDSLFQQTCLIAIKEGDTPFLDNELQGLDAIDMDLEDNTKTPSKRLRNVLYRLWEQDSKLDTDFKSFYKIRMEKIIEQIKTRLD